MASHPEHHKVYPHGAPLPEQKIKLTINDVYGPKIWAKQCYFYPLGSHTTGEKCFHALKEGLSRMLADMPRCAGQVRRGATDDPRDLVIHVNKNAHAIFYYQDLSDDASVPSYAELKGKGFPMEFEFGVKLLPATAFGPVCDGDIQVTGTLTKIKGGLCFATGHNHVLADAAGLVGIETTWAKHTADVSAGRPYKRHWNEQIDPQQLEFLSSPKEGAAEFDDENMIVLPASMSQLNLPMERPDPQEPLNAQRQARAEAAEEPEDEFKWGIYYFSAASLRQLRKDASRSDAPQPISRAAALGGLFWSRASYIKRQSEEGEEESQLYFPINVRHRIQPPVSSNFLANVVDIVPSKLSLEELEKNDGTALVTAALRVSQSVHGWSQPRWESWLNAAATLPADQAICPNPLVMLASTNIIFNDYSRTPTNLLEWGSDLGRIERMRYPRPAQGPATAIRVHPGLPDGGIEVAATGKSALLEALAKDEVFSKYAKMVCYPA